MDKDYYKILNIATTSDEQEIKKAYRQLVMKYHPDRNESVGMAAEHFKEVQEAYEVLSHPVKRSAYNQQRWYRYSSPEHQHNQPTTSYSILQKCRALNRYLSTLDRFDINRQALNNYILQLLSADNLQVLKSENDRSFGEFIIEELLKAAQLLQYKSFQKITGLLKSVAGDNSKTIEGINKYVKNKKFSEDWERFLPLVVLIIALLLCLLIYAVSKDANQL